MIDLCGAICVARFAWRDLRGAIYYHKNINRMRMILLNDTLWVFLYKNSTPDMLSRGFNQLIVGIVQPTPGRKMLETIHNQ